MMENRILFDGIERRSLLPLTFLRAICDCRVGMLTIKEKWELLWPGDYHIMTVDYLQALYPDLNQSEPTIYINSSVLPHRELVEEIQSLSPDQCLIKDGVIIAAHLSGNIKDLRRHFQSLPEASRQTSKCHISQIKYPEDILNYGDQEFLNDYQIMTHGRSTALTEAHVKLRGQEIFIEPTAKVYDCILNATAGPIYIGPDVEIMEQAVIKGPVGIGSNSTIHVGAKVYGHTFLGPHCKIGGEIKRTTIFGFSNKGHEGFLGDSVLTEWCNLGADTNNSNLKNTYGEVSLWDIEKESFRKTGRQFLGIIMGDHTKCAINTAFMTGSMTGIFANVFGAINWPRYIPSFSWGKEQDYMIEKAIEVAQRTMIRRNRPPSEAYINAMRHIASIS